MQKYTLKKFINDNPQYFVGVLFSLVFFIIIYLYSADFVAGERIMDYSESIEQTIMTGWFMRLFGFGFLSAATIVFINSYNRTKKNFKQLLK
jgi:hypothetical protein